MPAALLYSSFRIGHVVDGKGAEDAHGENRVTETTQVPASAPAPPPPQTPNRNHPRKPSFGGLAELAVPVGAIVLALIVGYFVMAIALKSLMLPLTGYWDLLTGAVGSLYDIQETLVYAIPLIFAAFAVAFAFRGGLFNIGAEGQLYVGALASTFVGYSLQWPGWILLPVCIVVGVLAGAAWALVPGLLKAYRGAHEVITTMMLNYVALNLMAYLLSNSTTTGAPGPMQGPQAGTPISPNVNVTFPIIVPGWLVPNAQLSAAFLLALVCGLIFWFVLSRTTLGYGVRATGFNIKAARYAGINVNRTIVLTLVISGAFAGLSGVSYVFGVGGNLSPSFDSFTYGFDAIAVALLGKNTAAGAILAAILFGALNHGQANMQASANIDTHIIQIIQGLIIFFVGAEALVRRLGLRGYTFARFITPRPEADVPVERSPL
jgi:general nucleoside transport system permease protein